MISRSRSSSTLPRQLVAETCPIICNLSICMTNGAMVPDLAFSSRQSSRSRSAVQFIIPADARREKILSSCSKWLHRVPVTTSTCNAFVTRSSPTFARGPLNLTLRSPHELIIRGASSNIHGYISYRSFLRSFWLKYLEKSKARVLWRSCFRNFSSIITSRSPIIGHVS